MSAVVFHGGDYGAWGFEAGGGMFGSSRLLMAAEGGGAGTQVVRVRAWPRFNPVVPIAFSVCVFLAVAATRDDALAAAGVLVLLAGLIVLRAVHDCGTATHTARRGLGLCNWHEGDARAEVFEPRHGQA